MASSEISYNFLTWLQFAFIPDEHFYSTLATLRVDKDGVRLHFDFDCAVCIWQSVVSERSSGLELPQQ